MNAKKVSFALSLISGGAFALLVGCASGDDSNTTPTGGTTTTPTGGTTTTPTGGTTTTPTGGSSSKDTVTFASGQAQGPMTGWGWVALGKDDSISSPTCDTGTPITSSSACTTSTVWSKTDALCITGNIPALPASPVQADYDNNWGVQIGVNSKEPNDGIGISFSTVDVKVTGATGYRVMLHKKGDSDATSYCYTYAGGPIKVTDFNTKCWGDPTTVTFPAADASMVDKIMVQIPSGSAAITVTDFCLSQIILK